MTTERLPRIAGTIHRPDGEVVQFHITDEGYSQWGLAPSQMGETADLLDALTGAAHGTNFFFHAPAPEEAEEDPADPDDDAAALAAAALLCIQHQHGLGIPDGCPLTALLPLNVMPSPDQFDAVYAITGRTEEDRNARSALYRSAATESAWARMELRRWAIRKPLSSAPTND